jgi:hypothetical protein
MSKSTLFKFILFATFLFTTNEAKLQIITTFAGNGIGAYSGDGGLATNAQIASPYNVSIDKENNIYIVDFYVSVIRKVNAITGIITTVAGKGNSGYAGDGGLAIQAQLNHPTAVVVDTFGNIYISDTRNFQIRRVDVNTGIITTVAGTGIQGFSGDGGPALNARFGEPDGITIDAQGNLLYIVDGKPITFCSKSLSVIFKRVISAGRAHAK